MMKNCQVSAYKKISQSGQQICKLIATVKENLSDLISRRLNELNISKAELARRTGLSRTYITDLANGTGNTQSGQYNLSPESVNLIAKELEINEAEILSAMKYLPNAADNTETIELLEGVTVTFQHQKMSKIDRNRILDAMRLVAAGARVNATDSETTDADIENSALPIGISGQSKWKPQ